ncbi:MAG: DUF3298 domain-containing protein [Ruminococcaceae bacterium]|nr:DUF3298 domain-containing protein [Oscillospiraceae bacterium]
MLRKILCLMLSMCILLLICSCGETSDTSPKENADNSTGEQTDGKTSPEDNTDSSGKEENYKPDEVSLLSVMLGDEFIEECKENNVVERAFWNKLRLSDTDAKKYPKLQNAFDKHNTDAEESAKALMYELDNAAKDLVGDEFNPTYISGETNTYIQRADSAIVSILDGTSVYSGGVHPDYYYATVNLDPETGEEIALSDVVFDFENLPEILVDEIIKKYDYVEFDKETLLEILKGYSEDDYNWTVDYQGITIWFSPYDIAAYTVGPLSAKVYFEDFAEMFNDKYSVTDIESYGMVLPMGQKIDFDLDPTDGERDSVEITTRTEEYGNYNMLSVTVNGKTVTDEIKYAYDFDVSLACVGDKAYLYSELWSDGDFHMFDTWDLNGEEPQIADELYGVQHYYEFIEAENLKYKQVINNPVSFRLTKKIEILGTRAGWANFKANEKSGIPEMMDKAYTLCDGHNITSKMSLDAELLPDMGKTQIPSGTELFPYQTDGESFVDAKTDDEIFRIRVDTSVRPTTVNGIPEEECFENIMYAG